MNRKLLVAIVSGVLAAPMAVQVQADEMEVKPHSHPATYEHEHEMEDGSMSPLHAHEHESHPHSELHTHGFTLYGSVRSGVYMIDPADGGDTQWDIGTVDSGNANRDSGSDAGDRLWSRIGVKASHELEGGMKAGLHLEKRLDGWRTRHQNVWLSGGFGKLTFGQQGSAYYSATTWDGSNLFGDWNRQAGSRVSGIRYSSNLGGPFNFDAMVLDSAAGGDTDADGMNATQFAGTLSTAAITLSAGYMNVSEDGMDWFGGSAGGAMAGLDWDVGFEVGEDGSAAENDAQRYGFTVGYSVGSTRAYVHYEDLQYDDEMNESTNTLFGVSHALVPGAVVVIAEYQAADDENNDRGAIAIRVDF